MPRHSLRKPGSSRASPVGFEVAASHRLKDAGRKLGGIDPANAGVLTEPAELPFAVDLRRGSPQAALGGVRRA